VMSVAEFDCKKASPWRSPPSVQAQVQTEDIIKEVSVTYYLKRARSAIETSVGSKSARKRFAESPIRLQPLGAAAQQRLPFPQRQWLAERTMARESTRVYPQRGDSCQEWGVMSLG